MNLKAQHGNIELDSEATWKTGNGDIHQLTDEEIESINIDDKLKFM